MKRKTVSLYESANGQAYNTRDEAELADIVHELGTDKPSELTEIAERGLKAARALKLIGRTGR